MSAAASAPWAPASASATSSASRSNQIQWLGFALTEACFFYGLVAGLLAAFIV
ncbi:MAG: hypothetical protein ABSH27_10795 [Solirubrobacteraceae bacterium]